MAKHYEQLLQRYTSSPYNNGEDTDINIYYYITSGVIYTDIRIGVEGGFVNNAGNPVTPRRARIEEFLKLLSRKPAEEVKQVSMF